MPRLRARAVLTEADLPIAASSDPVTDPPVGGAGAAENDTGAKAAALFGRLITYIPAEIIAVYQAIHVAMGGAVVEGDDIGASAVNGHPALLWIGVGLLLVTPLWIGFSTTDAGEEPPLHQIINGFVAFAIWLIMVGNPIQARLAALIGNWEPYYGSIAMILVVGIVFPLVEKIVEFRRKQSK